MSRTSPWFEKAYEVIEQVIQEGRNIQSKPNEIIKAVRDAYPFGERAYHPYKMWLKAQRELLRLHGLVDDEQAKAQREAVARMIADNPIFKPMS